MDVHAPPLSRFFPEGPQGEFSAAFTAMLKADCPACPWWDEARPLPPHGDPLPELFSRDFTELVGGGPPNEVNATAAHIFIDATAPQVSPPARPSWFVVLGPYACKRGAGCTATAVNARRSCLARRPGGCRRP